MITIKFIKEYIEELTGLKLDVKSRKRELTEYRFLAYTLSRELTSSTLVTIGDLYGVDHSLVYHGLKRFNELKDQPCFADKKEVYDKFLDVFSEDKVKSLGIEKLQTLKELQDSYDEKLKNKTSKYVNKIEYLEQKIKTYEVYPFFSKITELPEEEFLELKENINCFFVMNGFRKNRKNIINGRQYSKRS